MRLKREGTPPGVGVLGVIVAVGLLGLLVLEEVQGQAPAGSTTILNGHNAARASSQLSPRPQVALSNLTWNSTNADNANKYVEKCIYAHGGNAGEGQNLYVSANLTMDVDTAYARAINLWVATEKAWYTYSTVPNGCNGTTCGHYTQVIWANTKTVGCSYKVCNGNLQGWSASTSGFLVNCHYYPPGNYQNQYPYIAASASPTRTRTRTRTKSKSRTRSRTPSRSRTKSRTRSRSRTRTPSRTRTRTSPSRTKSRSRTRSRTRTRTRSRSFTRSITPTRTFTPTMTLTMSITPTFSITPSITSSPTLSATLSPTPSITPSFTSSNTASPTTSATPSSTTPPPDTP